MRNNYKPKILVVDDKPNNLHFFSKILTDKGYKVQRAISGQLALNGAIDALPDLILLDIIMPHMDGYEVCRRLKATPETREIPIIFLSALNEALDKVKAFEVGGVDYITKPFQVEEVLARIENQLTIQRLSKLLKEQNTQLQQEVAVRQQTEEELWQKSQVLANFSYHLKQLHRLNTNSYNNFEELFADYLQTGCNILNFSTGMISRIANQTYTISAVQSDLEVLKPNLECNLEDTYCAAVVSTKQTIAYAQVGEIPELQNHPAYQNLKLKSYIGTPIFVNGEIYGTLCFSSSQIKHQSFTVREQEFIELMAQSLGRVIATFQANIQRQQAERLLQESERRFRAIFNNTFQFTGLLTPEGTAIEVNQSALDFGGIQHAEIAGKPFWEARWWTTSPETQMRLKKAIASAAKGKFVRYEVDVRGAGELVATVDFSLKPIRDEMGKVVLLISEGRDISQFKHTLERLRLLERAIAASNNGILITDPQQPDHPIVYVNSGFERITGYAPQEVTGKNCRFLQGTDTQQPALAELQRAITEGRECQVLLRNYRKDGTLFWNEFSLTPVRDASGRLTNYIGVQTDITDLKQVEIELATAKATLEQQIRRELLLSQINEEIRSTLDPEQIFKTAATKIGQALGANRCLIHSYIHHSTPQIPFVAEYKDAGLTSISSLEIPVSGNPHLELLLTQDEAIASDDVYTDPLLEAAAPVCRQLGLKSMLAVRTSYHGQPNGVIGVHQYDRFRQWSTDEIELIESVAARVGIAIAQANLLQQETQRRLELDQQNQQLQTEIRVRQQVEEQLTASEQKLSFLVQNAPLAVIEWNLLGRVVTWNQAAERIFGYSTTEAIGKHWLQLIGSASDKAQAKGYFKRLLRKQGSLHSINENLTKCGRTIICEWYNTLLMEEQGCAVGFASIAMDITERQHRELLQKTQNTVLKMAAQGRSLQEVLQELTRQIDELTPQLRSSICLISEDGKYLHACAGPKIPQTWVQAIDPLLIGPNVGSCGTAAYCAKRVIVEDIATDPLWAAFKEQALAHDFRACWSEPIVSDQGKVLGTFALYFTEVRSPDLRELEVIESLARLASVIIQRKQAEAALQTAKEAAEAANRAKSDFLASMSHELRTPLTAILGFSQILARDESLATQQRENLEIINRSGEHLLTLINDVLSMSKIEAGRLTLKENSFDLYWLLDSLQEMLQLKANAKGLHLRFERHSNLPQFVQTDESKLRQVLINLIGNAIKFTQRGSVTLRVGMGNREWEIGNGKADKAHQPEKSSVSSLSADSRLPTPYSLVFEVEDTGQGIAIDEISTLFDPFVQTRTSCQSMEGTGLGLPISRKFVQLMGGDIAVSSTLEHGSIFSFSIKISEATATDVETKSRRRRVIGLEPEQPIYRILVVEDSEVNRLLLVKILTPLGFEVCKATNGQEAVALWQSWQPHLIWMDIQMPVMDGYQATKIIKQMPKGQETVIIALTASAFEEQREAILQAGCDDFVHKPFQEEVLLEKIALHLGMRYVYEEQEQPTSPQSGEKLKKLNPKDLAVMPPKWSAQLHRAAEGCQDEEVLKLLEQIPEPHAALKLALIDLVDNFRLDVIINLTQAFAHE